MALVPPVFSTGPTSIAAAIDIYGKPPTIAVTGISDAQTAINDLTKFQIADAFLPTTVSKIKTIADFATKVSKLDKKTVLANISANLGINKESLNNLKGNLLTNLLSASGYIDQPGAVANALLGVPGSLSAQDLVLNQYPQLKIVVNNVEHFRKGGDFDEVGAATTILKNVLGNQDVIQMLNLGTTVNAINAVTGVLAEYRIPEITDLIMSRLESRKEKEAYLTVSVPTAIKTSDLYLIQKGIDELGVERVKALYPNIVEELLTSYKHPTEDNVVSTENLNKLYTILNLFDQNWDKYTRNGVPVKNYGVFEKISKDALELLELDVSRRADVLIAKQLKKVDVVISFRKENPKVVFTK